MNGSRNSNNLSTNSGKTSSGVNSGSTKIEAIGSAVLRAGEGAGLREWRLYVNDQKGSQNELLVQYREGERADQWVTAGSYSSTK